MSDFMRALDAEIADLERKLSASPIYVKLRRAQELRDAYVITDAATPAVTIAEDRPRAGRPSASGTSALILDAVRAYLRGKHRVTPTRELMVMLETNGIAVGGTKPQNSVSSLLSKTPDIISHGRKGWTLADSGTEKAGDGTPAKETSPALLQPSPPEDSGKEVAHEEVGDIFR